MRNELTGDGNAVQANTVNGGVTFNTIGATSFVSLYQAAVDDLASNMPVRRMSGAQALVNLARQHPDQAVTVVSVLQVYLDTPRLAKRKRDRVGHERSVRYQLAAEALHGLDPDDAMIRSFIKRVLSGGVINECPHEK